MSEGHTPKSRAERLAWIAELGEFPNIGPDEVDPDPSEILAECARRHDGFAGSILGKMRQEREWAEQVARARERHAELDARFSRLVMRTAFWLASVAGFIGLYYIAFGLLLGWK